MLMGGRPNPKKVKRGGSLSARAENQKALLLNRLFGQAGRNQIAGFEGLLSRPIVSRPIKLVWGIITDRTGPAAPPVPPVGLADDFRYKAVSYDGSFQTDDFQRPLFVQYNGVPQVVAAYKAGESTQLNTICILGVDVPDSDGIPRTRLLLCQEKLDFELCPTNNGVSLQEMIREAVAAEVAARLAVQA